MSPSNDKPRLSYKFQRLREKLRSAIAAGELAGKLPGERALARRFHVNAKTLSKALTDLAAEGLLDRSIGRGTFVKGTQPLAAAQERWLLICDPDQAELPEVKLLRAACEHAEIVTDVAGLRPSFVNHFSAVIDFARATPADFLRDLMLRHVRLVAVAHEPQTYSINAVVPDGTLAASQLARELLLAGHRRFGVIEERGQTAVADGLRRAAQRIAPDTAIDVASPKDAPLLVEAGATALICATPSAAAMTRQVLDAHGIAVPARVSLVAIGITDAPPCSGYFVSPAKVADAVQQILRDPPLRPATLWLIGRFEDAATLTGTGDASQQPPAEIMAMTV